MKYLTFGLMAVCAGVGLYLFVWVSGDDVRTHVAADVCMDALTAVVSSPSSLEVNEVDVLRGDIEYEDAVAWVNSEYSSDAALSVLKRKYDDGKPMQRLFVSIDYAAEEGFGRSRSNMLCEYAFDMMGQVKLQTLTYQDVDYRQGDQIFLTRTRPERLSYIWGVDDISHLDRIGYMFSALRGY